MSATESAPPVIHREAPWTVGLRAARANLIPGLVVQGLMLALLLGYYFYPPLKEWLDALADVRARWGFRYAAVNSIVAGALIPELLRIFFFQRCCVRKSNFSNLLFTVPFYCFMGLAVDLFYRCQAIWFGEAVTVATVAKKVLVDQFLYNPLFACPVMNWLYDWRARGYRFQGTGVFFTAGYYREFVVPTLFATWGVWIPVMVILYSLPTLLQIPLFGLALTLWVMLYTWITEQRKV